MTSGSGPPETAESFGSGEVFVDRTIGELASRPVVSVEAETTVMAALQLMSARRISCVVVLQQDEPIGILTERDVVFAANWVLGQPDLRMREVMSKPVLTALSETTITDAYRLFQEHRIRHLVVLSPRMELDGIFTQTNLVSALRSKFFAGMGEVSGLMSSQVVHVSPQVTARHALALMASHAISAVVVGEQGRPLGMFTERDAVRLVATGADIGNLPVSAVMSAPVQTIQAAASPVDALELMASREVRRLLVLDSQGGMAGVLTQTDLSRVVEHRAIAWGNPPDALTAQSPTLLH